MPDPVNDNDDPAGKAGDDAAPPAGRCPICGKPTELRWRPFCSRRCADIDLHRWLSGGYAIPASDTPPKDGEDDA
ncbi:DNA gyrase inhibitor YacG [Pseudochelatococcus sp. B33]